MSAVICKNLRKIYGEEKTFVTALDDVNFEIKKGELVMLVGPSGCGKTTLLSIISGILTQTEGSCRCLDIEINALSNGEKTAFRAKNIGFAFQSFNLIPMLNAQENASVPLILNGIPKEKAMHQAEELLIQVGLRERMHAFPSQLSGGEQQRIAIVRSCIHKPKIIVSDEPTSALDHETGEKVLSLFKDIALRKDTAIIIVTHDTRILHFADRVFKMEDGKILFETTKFTETII